jgi:phospholipid transport system substrate-binding protein
MPRPHRGFCRTLGFVLLLALVPPGHALAADDASAFIVKLGQQAMATTGSAISPAERVKTFAVIVDRNFDVPKIAEFMLGRYWQTATDSERNNFTSVFRAYMIRVYSDHFGLYRDDSFRVIDQRAESTAVTIVRTNIIAIASGQPMTLEWRVIREPDGFKVADLIVGGVSLATAQREEFASAMRLDGGEVSILISQMRSKLTHLETAGQ